MLFEPSCTVYALTQVLEVNDKFAWLQCQKKAGIEAQATLAEEEQATLAKSLVQVCRVYLFIIK